MDEQVQYQETVSSPWTEALFIALTVIFGGLAIWRLAVSGWAFLAILFTILAFVFLFYSINYRVLVIRLTPNALKLKFGIFTYRIPLANIQDCQLDEPPWLVKYGGAGIHFILAQGRYRASFNFLEHPRIVVSLRKKAGFVRDISFTTRHPDRLLAMVKDNLGTRKSPT